MARPRPATTLLVLVAALAAVSALLTLFAPAFHPRPDAPVAPPALAHLQDALVAPAPQHDPPHGPPADPWQQNVSRWVNGAPTDSLQDNLRADTQYVTTWVAGGWTNDFMTYINMVYLGLLTARTPVLPPFAPSHVAHDAGFPPFGDVFDVPRLAAAIGSPLLEWRDLKREGSAHTDPLGCWSTWSLVDSRGQPRHSIIPAHLRLNVSYTALPPDAARVAGMPAGPWLQFSALADLAAPAARARALAQRPPPPGARAPDARLLCFDFMYYVGAARHDEWWADWSPAWRIVGRHARWAPPLEREARAAVRAALELPADDDGADGGADFPPYVAVHVRRGDFTAACGHKSAAACFPPLAAYARHVAAVRATLAARAPPPRAVLVTSDEADAAWWAGVAALGWRRVPHPAGGGGWRAPLVDAVVQSRAVGFVGTDRSTMSLVARRRVEDWQGGVGELVRIGGEEPEE